MDLTTATPVEIDTKLAELYAREAKARSTYNRIQDSIQTATIRKARGEFPCYTPYNEEDVQAAYEELHSIIEEELPLEAEYERRPWQRYWHVTNVNGHIHDSQACTSCYPDTQYAWRVDLSGLRDTEVVEREAYNACSVCMPIAPAEQKAARERYTREQREARKAEREAKKDAKAVKARERAVKLVDKAEKAIEKLGGREGFAKLTGSEVYAEGFDMQQTVYEVLSYLKDMQEGDPRPIYRPNEYVLAELRERGLAS